MSLRRVFFLLIPLCLLGLGVSLWLLLRPVTTPSPELPQPLYILGQQEGHVAVFSPDEPLDGQPLRVYPIYTRLLPETDQRRLQAGLEIYSEMQLQQRLEDYGL